MKKMLSPLISFLLLGGCLNLIACYRMPYEDEYSVVPSVNNPDVTREKPSNNLMPNANF